MENHPIPQDVTGFKFRLIGSVTVKQFLYLLGAGIIALLFYLLPFPFLIKLPFMLLSGGVGLCLAFVPLDGRPMDKMIFSFIKAIPAENQYIYKKQGVEMPYFAFTPPVHTKSAEISTHDSAALQKAKLFNQLEKSYFKPDPEDQEKVASISTLFQDGQTGAQGFTNRVIHADTPPASLISIVKPPVAEPVTQNAPAAVAPIQPAPTPVITQPVTPAPVPVSPAVAAPTPIPTPPIAPPVQPESQGGIDIPNILQGVVHDPRGKPLPHVIVEVLDAHNVALRTFRTDTNGFFRAATPLPNGTYTVHLEDTLKKQEFQNVTVTMSGTVLPAIQVTSIDQREKLRQELFGVAHNSA